MSRTFRNTNVVPVGWAVRDDGHLYHLGEHFYGRGGPLLENNPHFRAPRYRRRHINKEKTWARRMLNRKYRAVTRLQVTIGRYDEILPPVRTSGWESW